MTSANNLETPYDGLTPDVVMNAVESLGFFSDARIFPLNSYENRVYQVGVEDSTPLIVKFYRPHRWNAAQIEEEHQFSLALLELDIPVVAPLVIEGKTLFEYHDFLFGIYPRRGGHAPELENLDHLYILGQTLGKMHALGRTRTFQHRPSLDVAEFGRASQAFLLSHWIPQSLQAEYRSLSDTALTLIEDKWRNVAFQPLRLHGDCHPGNILWREDKPNFVDLDDARNGPAVQDLWMLLSGERNQHALQMATLLDGYEEFCDFQLAELALIESLRTLRIMHYAAWLGRRWQDPAFPRYFPWFGSDHYWAQHLLSLREQVSNLNQPSLQLGFR